MDTELIYAYAKNRDLGPLEEFISGNHLANLQSVADRCVCFPGGGGSVCACMFVQLNVSSVVTGLQ